MNNEILLGVVKDLVITDEFEYEYDYTGEIDENGQACGYGVAKTTEVGDKGDPYVFAYEGTFFKN